MIASQNETGLRIAISEVMHWHLRPLILLSFLVLSFTTGFSPGAEGSTNQCVSFFLQSQSVAAAPKKEVVRTEAVLKSSPVLRQEKIKNFRDRMEKIVSVMTYEAQQVYVQQGRDLVNAVEKHASDLDLRIFDNYLSILEASQHYLDLFVGSKDYENTTKSSQVKSTRLGSDQWTFPKMKEYLFESPSILTFTKEQDLRYLEYINQYSKQKTNWEIRDLIREASHNWTLHEMQNEPALRRQYEAFLQGRNREKMQTDFSIKVFWWTHEVPRGQRRNQREEFEDAAWVLTKNHLSIDNLLGSQYFDLVAKFPDYKKDFLSFLKKAPSVRPTDWEFFSKGLNSGKAKDITDFLFQNGHDLKPKIHLMKILNQMEKSFTGAKDETFTSLFDKARRIVEEKMPHIEAPLEYQTDMDLYVYRQFPEKKESNKFEKVSVRWNSVLGQLQSSVSMERTFRSSMKWVKDIPGLKKQILAYFQILVNLKTYTPEEAKKYAAQELDSPLSESTYVTFKDPVDSSIVGMTRLFDANKGSLTYIERKFPQFQLPEREQGIPIYELGRMMTTRRVEAKSMSLLMARVAEYFENTRSDGMIYFDCSPAVARHHRRMGAVDVFKPMDLGYENNQTGLYVMKISVENFIKQFKTPDYEALHLREGSEPESAQVEKQQGRNILSIIKDKVFRK